MTVNDNCQAKYVVKKLGNMDVYDGDPAMSGAYSPNAIIEVGKEALISLKLRDEPKRSDS